MRTIRDLSQSERDVLEALRKKIRAELPGREFRMTLFGSRARGDAQADSDMDVLLEIETEELGFADKRRLRRLASELSMDSGIMLFLFIVDRRLREERGDFSIFEDIREEGIPV